MAQDSNNTAADNDSAGTPQDPKELVTSQAKGPTGAAKYLTDMAKDHTDAPKDPTDAAKDPVNVVQDPTEYPTDVIRDTIDADTPEPEDAAK